MNSIPLFLYINHLLFSEDNGRVLGYDNNHDFHHSHYLGKISEVTDFKSYQDLVDRFERDISLVGTASLLGHASLGVYKMSIELKTGSISDFFSSVRETSKEMDIGETFTKKNIIWVSPNDLMAILKPERTKIEFKAGFFGF